jgi:hypothetical protein
MAIGALAGLVVIVLMILLARPEMLGRAQGCVYLVPHAAEQLYHLLGGAELGVVEVEYLASVLGTYVGTDAVGLRGVVNLEEESAQGLVAHHVGIVLYPHGLYMVGAMSLDIGIHGILFGAANVAYRGGDDARSTLQLILYAPEAACGKDSLLSLHNCYLILVFGFFYLRRYE